MNRNFIYRTPGTGSEGGPGPGFSLDDLDNDEIVAPEKPAGDGKGEGDDADPDKDKPKAETDAEREARETKEAADVEKLRLEDEKKKNEEKPKPAKAADAKLEDDETPPEGGDDEPDEAEEFINEVNALRGDVLDVDYGDVDPLSPEGVVLREAAVADQAITQFEESLEKAYPKAYAYLIHSMSGKPEEEFFGKATNLDVLPTVEQIEASVEVQKQIVLKDLIARGNSEKHANLIVTQAITDSELEDLAKESLASQTKAQTAELDRIKADNDQALLEKETAITEMGTFIDQVVNKGVVNNITIPEKDRAAFAAEFKKNIRFDNGKFMLVSTLTNDNVQEVFAKEYFAYKKGNLGQLVTAAAKTENAKRLKRTIPAKTVPKGSGAEDRTRTMTLGELEAE